MAVTNQRYVTVFLSLILFVRVKEPMVSFALKISLTFVFNLLYTFLFIKKETKCIWLTMNSWWIITLEIKQNHAYAFVYPTI